MSKVLQELQFSIGPLCKDRGGEWFHDLLNRNGLTRQLVFGGTWEAVNEDSAFILEPTHQTSPKAPIPTGCKSVYLVWGQFLSFQAANVMCTCS